MKNESMIGSGLYGTWTFVTETMTDIGYYKGRAYMIMHIMPDPMQVRSCQLEQCSELSNHICQHKEKKLEVTETLFAGDDDYECFNTETSVVEWSDVTAFFQFGFQLRTGIAFKTYTNVNTSDWLGPYNMIMARVPHKQDDDDEEKNSDNNNMNATKPIRHLQKYISRYVKTPAANEIQLPTDSTIIQPETFDRFVGLTAINQSIYTQQQLQPGQDPYAAYHSTCVKGDIPAGILPRIQLGMLTTITSDDAATGATTSNGDQHEVVLSDDNLSSTSTKISLLRVDYSILSIPDPKSKLYKLWPSLQKHLGTAFPLKGPYCYGNDPKRAYTIHLSYDSSYNNNTNNETWQVIKGCIPDLPCWSDESPIIPYDNGATGIHILDPTGIFALICYFLGFLLIISLVFNCQLSNQLKRLQQQSQQTSQTQHHGHPRSSTAASPSGRPVPQQQVFEAFNDLEEPLLSVDDANIDDENVDPQNVPQTPSTSDLRNEDDERGSGAEESKVEAKE